MIASNKTARLGESWRAVLFSRNQVFVAVNGAVQDTWLRSDAFVARASDRRLERVPRNARIRRAISGRR